MCLHGMNTSQSDTHALVREILSPCNLTVKLITDDIWSCLSPLIYLMPATSVILIINPVSGTISDNHIDDVWSTIRGLARQRYWSLIGPEWSRDLDTGLSLVQSDHMTSILPGIWLVYTSGDGQTQILPNLLEILTTEEECSTLLKMKYWLMDNFPGWDYHHGWTESTNFKLHILTRLF